MFRKIVFILFLYLLQCGPWQSLVAQHSDLVYRQDDGFYLGCEKFYPMMINYPVSFEDSSGHFRITPPMNTCRKEQGCLSCGTSAYQYRNHIVDHFRTIQAMGFNTVRITGLALRYDDEKDASGNFTGTLMTTKFYKFGGYGEARPHCHSQTEKGLPMDTREDFQRHGDLIAQLFSVIREEKIPLKVMLVTGAHGVEVRSDLYAEYLAYLAGRFRQEPILFAYDLYNEPQYLEKIDTRSFDKYDRASWFADWYDAIKDRAPWQLVTYGPALADVFGWDPEIMPADFFSFHLYSNPLEVMDWQFDTTFSFYNASLKYLHRHFSRPWMIGETGLAAVDRKLYPDARIHPIVRSEQEQRAFFKNALEAARRNGAEGFGVWQFKDGIYAMEKLNTPLAKEFFMGVENFLDNNAWKEAAYLFDGFDPDDTTGFYREPLNEEYFNSRHFPFELASGHVFAADDPGVEQAACEGAYVSALLGVPGSNKYNHTINTFTDASGKFTLWSGYEDVTIVVKQLRISAPGRSLVYLENWGPAGLSLDRPFILRPLDRNRLPKPLTPAPVLEVRAKEERWEQSRVLVEKDLVIKKGSRLILTDTLFMMPWGAIEVEAGGVLEIDGGAVAGLCSWEGITVQESDRKRRRQIPAGRVELRNGGSILDAVNAITTTGPGERDNR